jgi:hypothetical protein
MIDKFYLVIRWISIMDLYPQMLAKPVSMQIF